MKYISAVHKNGELDIVTVGKSVVVTRKPSGLTFFHKLGVREAIIGREIVTMSEQEAELHRHVDIGIHTKRPQCATDISTFVSIGEHGVNVDSVKTSGDFMCVVFEDDNVYFEGYKHSVFCHEAGGEKDELTVCSVYKFLQELYCVSRVNIFDFNIMLIADGIHFFVIHFHNDKKAKTYFESMQKSFVKHFMLGKRLFSWSGKK